MDDKVVFYLRGVPATVRANFKEACARRRVTMRQMTLALLQIVSETSKLSLTVPSEEGKWLERVIKQIERNDRDKGSGPIKRLPRR